MRILLDSEQAFLASALRAAAEHYDSDAGKTKSARDAGLIYLKSARALALAEQIERANAVAIN